VNLFGFSEPKKKRLEVLQLRSGVGVIFGVGYFYGEKLEEYKFTRKSKYKRELLDLLEYASINELL
jgi:hypothetical protein